MHYPRLCGAIRQIWLNSRPLKFLPITFLEIYHILVFMWHYSVYLQFKKIELVNIWRYNSSWVLVNYIQFWQYGIFHQENQYGFWIKQQARISQSHLVYRFCTYIDASMTEGGMTGRNVGVTGGYIIWWAILVFYYITLSSVFRYVRIFCLFLSP